MVENLVVLANAMNETSSLFLQFPTDYYLSNFSFFMLSKASKDS